MYRYTTAIAFCCPFLPFPYIPFWERGKISYQNPLWHGYLHISHRRQNQRPPICQEMKDLADTEGSLTLQPLTATGIHNLPAMNPFTYQEGVSLSMEWGYGGQHTGGRERSSMTQHEGDFRQSSKHILVLHAWTITYISNSSSRFRPKRKLFEVVLLNVQKTSKLETNCGTSYR